MSNLNSQIFIKMELRLCMVKGRKALFHKWSDSSRIVEPSPMIGGHRGGIINYTVGIIEYEDGTVTECYPEEIKFADGDFAQYCFGD